MAVAKVEDITDCLREAFAERADTNRFPDASAVRIKIVTSTPDFAMGWGIAVGKPDRIELLRVIPSRPKDIAAEQAAVNMGLAEAMKKSHAIFACCYSPADGFAPSGWERIKSIYSRTNGRRYVLYTTDGRLKVKTRPDDGRGIPPAR